MPISDTSPRLQLAPWCAPLSVIEAHIAPGELVLCSDDLSFYYKTRPLDSDNNVITDQVQLLQVGGSGSGSTGGGSGVTVGNETYLLSMLTENGVGILSELDSTTNTATYTLVIKKGSSLVPVSADTILADSNIANGPVILGTDGKISTNLLPNIVVKLEADGKIQDSYISNSFIRETWVVSSSTNLSTLVSAKKGDIASIVNGASYILKDSPPTNVNNWIKISDGPSSNNAPIGSVHTGSSSTLSNIMNLPAVSGIQQLNQMGILVEQGNALRLVIRTLEGFLPIGARWLDIIGKPTSMAELGVTDYVSATSKGVPNGLATLDSTGKLSINQIPTQSISAVYDANTTVEMNAILEADAGDFCYVYSNQGLYIKNSSNIWNQVGVGSVTFSSILQKPTSVDGYGITDAVKTYGGILFTDTLPDKLKKIYVDGYVKESIVNYSSAGTYTMSLGKINYVKTNGVVLTFPVNAPQSQTINSTPFTPANRNIEVGDWVVVKVKTGFESTVSAANTLIEGGSDSILRNDPLPVKFTYAGTVDGWIVT